ncbi:glycosyltransferase [Aeoliella mucimassa]|uniref:Glycosyl transferases group 1 n=1 Tax=Aeoliella mucimassa TaxID=2527972 RepID=A0A518AW92_9BACT|nr:glycosyltransferase [Aeoliella mucimassa]QDU59009.1 Glycosyl transferases group 1 [Aeoliella mucimassa]
MSHRILHVVRSLDRYTSAESLLGLLDARPADDWDHRVVVLGSPQGELADAFAELQVPLTFMQQRWRLDPTTAGRVSSAIRQHDPEVLHAWDSSSLHYVLAAAMASSVPRMVAEWDLDAIDNTLSLPTKWLALPRRQLRFVVPSQRVGDWLGQRVSPARISTIAPACKLPSEPGVDRDAVLAEFSLPADAVLVGTACPLQVEFGVKELIWAADMVRVLHPQLRYLIAGDGPERRHLEQFGRTAAVPENICFLGDTDRWPAVLPHLQAYWQGTEANASSPTTMLDAMAAGVPVIASDTPQHRDWIEHEQTGYLVNYDARAERTRLTHLLLEDASVAETLAAAAKDLVRDTYSPDTRVSAYEKLYVDLLA